MFCPKCGAELPEGSAFCPTCGEKLQAAPEAPKAEAATGHPLTADHTAIRQRAWDALVAKPLMPILLYVAVSLVNMVFGWIPFVNFILPLLVTLPLMYAMAWAYLKFLRGEDEKMVENTFRETYTDYVRALLVSLLTAVYTFLWSMLFIIPGIIKSISYAMTPFIAHEHPEMTAEQCICESMRMMDGHKMEYFILQLTFLGWILLGMITCGLGMFFVMPYIQIANAQFYESLKAQQA